MESKIVDLDKMKSIVVWWLLKNSIKFDSLQNAILERKDYVIDGKLISSREIGQDTLIEDVSQESVSVSDQEMDSLRLMFTLFFYLLVCQILQWNGQFQVCWLSTQSSV